ncbi:hypothetical protein QTP88_008272 [Uroleucon formosanum]
MTPIVEIAAARFTQYTQAMEDEDARRLQWLSTRKKMQLTISSSKTDLVQKVKLDKDNDAHAPSWFSRKTDQLCAVSTGGCIMYLVYGTCLSLTNANERVSFMRQQSDGQLYCQHVRTCATTGHHKAKCATQDLFELLERVQSNRLDDQRCVLPPYFAQVSKPHVGLYFYILD